ncbi:MAG: hypothetical protein A2338_04085 [Bacteroidetes bacterium RIFOXYB12_FULL_41_6]|nr:MAG: hypothetical protein A2338_04085 [Bacteroidetes bacterium RIFOXYB12_FULL_41_6]
MDKLETIPHLVIGLEVEGNLTDISREAGPLAENYLGKDEILDFIQIDNSNGVSNYFLNQTEPFYRKK